MARGRKIYEPPRFMSTSVACQQLVDIVEKMEESSGDNLVSKSSDVVCLSRIGTDTQKIVVASLKEAAEIDMGPPLHSLVIPGDCHFLEQDALKMWRL